MTLAANGTDGTDTTDAPDGTDSSGPVPPRAARAGAERSDFAPLSRAVRDAGLLRRSPVRTALSVAASQVALLACWAAVIVVGRTGTPWVLALAVPLGIATTRSAFVGHDAGHHQLFESDRWNDLTGLVLGNLGFGMSYAWWKTKHTRHHAHPNHTGYDPDVAGGALAWSVEQAVGRQGFTAWVTRHQAGLFFPMLTLEAFNLKVSGIRDLRARPAGPRRRLELALLAVHFTWYLTVLFVFLPVPLVVGFILLHQMAFGLHLGSVFAPSHKGMDLADEHGDWTHLRRQVLTSRNVSGGRLIDWMMGGLNHQIEHHLFPAMPRHNLRRATGLVRAHCEGSGLPYTSVRLFTSYGLALRYLADVGRRGLRAQD